MKIPHKGVKMRWRTVSIANVQVRIEEPFYFLLRELDRNQIEKKVAELWQEGEKNYTRCVRVAIAQIAWDTLVELERRAKEEHDKHQKCLETVYNLVYKKDVS